MGVCPACAASVSPFASYCTVCFEPFDDEPQRPAVAEVSADAPLLAYAGAPAPEWAQPLPPAPSPPPAPAWASPPPTATSTWATGVPEWGRPSTPGLAPAPTWEPAPAPSAENARKVWITTAVAIGLGALLQLGFYLYGRDDSVAPAKIITYSLLATAALYLVVLVVVFFRSWSLEGVVTPQWTVGSKRGSAALGASVGVMLAGVLLLILKAATGEPVTDAGVSLLVGERDLARTLLAVLVVVVAAPVVEELLFRGLLAEGLRDRGTKVAIWASAAAFSAWHLQPAQFRYYAVIGALLGWLYIRRGLIASMSAHAAFNGLLVVVAIAVAAGPARMVENNGVSIAAPAQWKPAESGLPGIDLALEGPSGAAMIVGHENIPAGVVVTTESVLEGLATPGAILPGFKIRLPSARIEDLPFGRAVRLEVTEADGQGGQLIMVPMGRRVWTIVLVDSGSSRARADFARMLPTLRLP